MKTKPIRKDPDELWSSYLLRRLESEGLLKTRNKLQFECDSLEDNTFRLCAGIDLNYNKGDTDSIELGLEYKTTFFIKSLANKFGGIEFKLIDENISVTEIAFSFKKNVAKLELELMDENAEIKHEPFIKYKSNVEAGIINVKYPPEGVIDDFVQYVKSVGIKEK